MIHDLGDAQRRGGVQHKQGLVERTPVGCTGHGTRLDDGCSVEDDGATVQVPDGLPRTVLPGIGTVQGVNDGG